MQSFRTELENPLVEKDIVDLEKKIRLFREGKINEEKFRSLRLARGVYGQRQQGVQMVRIKLPYGRMSVKQLLRIADISDEYATGNLHLTTRQDIQIHYVSLESTPELWSKLEMDNITLREACGNTVRNITASAIAGIDPDEPFDVSPYAHEMFKYFLRNPICQEMGRKIKIAFSSSDKDSAVTYIHDLGFIPKVRKEGDLEIRGFKVVVGGGLGAQPHIAKVTQEFLREELIIPYTEAVLRVFDRYGERTNRNKARLKFLINKIGFEEFNRLVIEEGIALKTKTYFVDYSSYNQITAPELKSVDTVDVNDISKYQAWRKTNVFEQKQKSFFGVYIKVSTGDIKTDKSRLLAAVVNKYAADDVRITINQGLLLKFVREQYLPNIFNELNELGLAEPGFDSVADITSCPGTDTCNLGISSSTGITRELEKVILEEYPDLIYNSDIKIKISGCMNSCGQHGLANIGFHGSSIKVGLNVAPALQVLLGGGGLGDGSGRIADKVLKVPSKRAPAVLRAILDDYDSNSLDGEYFNDYYDRRTERYFYQLLKPFADLSTFQDDEFVDWGHEAKYAPAIGVGECAGVMIDLVATLLYESEEKLGWANESLSQFHYSDSIYHSYAVFINSAKALLLDRQVICNTQNGIINDFDKHFVETGIFSFEASFRSHVLQINQQEPSDNFAHTYFNAAKDFYDKCILYRQNQYKSLSEQVK